LTPKLSLITPAASQIAALRDLTEARIALGRTGGGLPTRAAQNFLLDHAHARQAVWSPLDSDHLVAEIQALGFKTMSAASDANDRAEYLRRPDLGRRLSSASCRELSALHEKAEIAIVVADGLSAKAVELNAVPVIAALKPLLLASGFSTAIIVIATQARVALGDGIGEALGAKATVMLIGERPGLSAADSLGAYLTYAPQPGLADSSRNCISNIRDGGLKPAEAAVQIHGLLQRMIRHKASGIALEEKTENGLTVSSTAAIP
jgi:ethanolamine ammonia-lyase small subunit